MNISSISQQCIAMHCKGTKMWVELGGIQFSTQFQFQQRILPWNQLQLRKTNGKWKMPGFDFKKWNTLFGKEPTFYLKHVKRERNKGDAPLLG